MGQMRRAFASVGYNLYSEIVWLTIGINILFNKKTENGFSRPCGTCGHGAPQSGVENAGLFPMVPGGTNFPGACFDGKNRRFVNGRGCF